MSKHSLRHAVKIQGDHAKIRDALTTRQGLQAWTTAEVSSGAKDSNHWSLKYKDGPTFVWEITERDSDSVVWKCVEGPGDSVGTVADFHLVKQADGRVHVDFEHAGWPHEEGNFTKCNSLWGVMLHRLRAHVEGQVPPVSA
jgi:hypothetical protein